MTEQLIMFGKQKEYEIANEIYTAVKSGADFSAPLGKMLEIAEKHHIGGNIYKSFIAWLIINDENPYSLSCELNAKETGGLYNFAKLDAHKLMLLFSLDFSSYSSFADSFNDFSYSNNFGCQNLNEIGELAGSLANRLDKCENEDEFLNEISAFYQKHGVGTFGLNKAFYVDTSDELKLIPISDFDNATMEDMWGYEYQKEQLCKNTEAFLNKKAANNVLLYGDSGTGKSTSIKAILNEYHKDGLRMIEVYKHQFSYLPQIIEMLRTREYRFIIYMDDLSFEDFEIEYKYLKAIIEGGLAKKPDNVLIYATSNRRHLIKESFSDRDSSDDKHGNDTVQEKLSLADRFGLSIGFYKPLQKEYFEIVKYLAKCNNLQIDEQQLIDGARAWGVKHGGISGRVARQYINHLL